MWVDILLPLYKKQRWKLFEGYGYPVLFWSTLLMQMNCVRPAIEGLVCKLACRKNIELINRNLIFLNSIHDNMIVHYRCWWVWWFAPRSRIQNNCSLTFFLCVRLHKWKWRWSTPPNGAKMVDGVGLPARVIFYRRQIKLSTTARQLRDKKVIRSFQSMATMQWSIYGKFRGPGQVLHKYRTFVYRFQWALFSRERDEMMAERRNDHFYIGTWAQLLMIHL